MKVTKSPADDHDFRAGEGQAAGQVLASKAADLMYDRANKLDQLLGNGTGLDDLPGDLGVAGVAGTLDARVTPRPVNRRRSPARLS